jgi:DNA-binding response OmpR family regulator
MTAVLPKPFSSNVLLAAVEETLKRGQD